MDQDSKKNLEKLREQAQSARVFSNLASLSGVVAIPLAFIGAVIGNKVLAVGSLCWLVSHFVGYMTRMAHEEHKEILARLNLAEAAYLAAERSRQSPLPRIVSMN